MSLCIVKEILIRYSLLAIYGFLKTVIKEKKIKLDIEKLLYN